MELECELCGKPHKPSRSDPYCSSKCRVFALFYRLLRDDPEAKFVPVQQAARMVLAEGRRRGFINPKRRCAGCGVGGRIGGHHPDYRQAHLIVWLCSACHRSAHRHKHIGERVAMLAAPQCEPPIPKNGMDGVTHARIDRPGAQVPDEIVSYYSNKSASPAHSASEAK